MQTINISNLKARLSEQIRKVRAGQSIIVLDRDTPVARIVPAGRDGLNGLVIRKGRGKIRKPVHSVRLRVDPTLLISEDRGS